MNRFIAGENASSSLGTVKVVKVYNKLFNNSSKLFCDVLKGREIIKELEIQEFKDFEYFVLNDLIYYPN